MKVGDSFRVHYNVGNPNNRTLHIRGIVDEKIICRRWSPGRGWRYEMLDELFFQFNKDHIIWLRPHKKKR